MKTIFQQLEHIISEHKNRYEVLVLKGFSNQVLSELNKTFPHCSGTLPLNNEGKLDLKLIRGSFTKILTGAISATADKPGMLEFESYAQLSRNVTLDEIGKQFLVIENNLLADYPNQSNSTADDFEDLINANREIPEDSLFHNFYSNATAYEEMVLVQFTDGIADEFSCVEVVPLFKTIEPEFIRIAPEEKIVVDYHYQFQPLSKEYLDLKVAIYNGATVEQLSFTVDDTIKQQKDALHELTLFKGVLEALEIPCKVYIQDIRLRQEHRPELEDILEQHWGSREFRKLSLYKDPDISTELIQISQADVVEEVIQQFENGQKGELIRDIFLTAPTGAGKSLLFQLPAMYLTDTYNAVTIVISPLIALMKDQVFALQNERKYAQVAYLNSELSLMDREDVLNQVHKGQISILYLSPELLLSYDLRTFIGERQLGLLVVDEAHLVTTWGRDFRVDYWYLGNFIRKIRKYHDYKFPVMAVTATAVYNGPNDMAFETLDSLSMENAIMYIGKVRRDEIQFDIKQHPIKNAHEAEKIALTANRITEFHKDHKKAIVYCPWTSHLGPIRDRLPAEERSLVDVYYGGLDKELKNETYEKFKANDIKTIISTKAFGMGVDIDDITMVYHHAPSGHLADYVQEIGRLARRKNLIGKAKIDFARQDLKFTKILYGLSSIKQYQIAMVLEKLLKVYEVKQKRNMVVSVEDFEYIFNFENVDIEQKVKSSLMLLEKDLLAKYQYNVIIARPKSLFTNVFARINSEQESAFLGKYGSYCTYINKPDIEAKGQKVYLIQLDKVWEHHFSDKSFPVIKKEYFEKTLFEAEGLMVSPQTRLTFNLNQSSKEAFELLTTRFEVVEKSLSEMSGNFFTKKDFTLSLNKSLQNKLLSKRISDLILSIYASPVIARGRQFAFSKPECFIQQKRVNHEYQYRIFQKDYQRVKSAMRKRFHRMFGDMHPEARTRIFYLPTNTDRNIGMVQLAYVLEAFDLATYEMAGGEKPGVFIRINDPIKLKRILKKGYSNQILREIDQRQKTSVAIMEFFFLNSLTDEERWTFIEKYFLGTPVEELIGEQAGNLLNQTEE